MCIPLDVEMAMPQGEDRNLQLLDGKGQPLCYFGLDRNAGSQGKVRPQQQTCESDHRQNVANAQFPFECRLRRLKYTLVGLEFSHPFLTPFL